MIKRRFNFLSQLRLDVPHFKSIESSLAADFDDLTRGLITESSPYIIRGLKLNYGLNDVAKRCTLEVADSAILHSTATEAGTILVIPASTPAEVLDSNNLNVSGSFVSGGVTAITNFVALDYVRAVDDTSVDIAAFINPDTLVEFNKTVPLGILLNYKIIINTTGFGATALPIAKVDVDINGNVVKVTDCRPMLFRLGTGGIAPDPFYVYPWPDGASTVGSGRFENPSTVASGDLPALNPFEGGDKETPSLKGWMDSVMSRIIEMDGGAYWYQLGGASGSLKLLREDAINLKMTGVGRFIHSDLTPGELTWSSDIYLRFLMGSLDYKILPTASPINLLDGEVAYLPLVRDVEVSPARLTFTNGSAIVTSVTNWTSVVQVGDYIRAKAHGDEFYTQIQSIDGLVLGLYQVTLVSPYTGTTIIDGIAVHATRVYDPATDVFVAPRASVPNNANNYWLAFRDDNFSSTPLAIDVAPVGAVRSSGVVTITTTAPHGFVPGQSVKIVGVTDTSFNVSVEILATPLTTTFTFNQSGADATSGSGTVASRAKIYLRCGMELAQGESRQIDDNISDNILAYIGMPDETSVPNYIAVSTGALAGQTNYGAVSGEDLTARASRLTTMVADKAQDKNVRLREGGNITWLVSGPPANTLVWDAAFTVEIPGSTNNNTIAANPIGIALTAGQAAYITIDRNASAVLVPTVVAEASVPIGENVFVFAHRGSNLRVYMMDGTSLGDGDAVLLGAAGTGGGGSDDYDRHQDALNANEFEEIFIDTLDNQDSIFAANTTAIYSGSKKAMQSTADAALVDYDPLAGAFPPADPNFPWGEAGTAAVALTGGKLRITSTGANFHRYLRTEVISVAKAHQEIKSGVRVASTTPDANNFTGIFWEINDDTHRFAVGVFLVAGVYTLRFLNAANTAMLTNTVAYAFDPSVVERTIRLAKIGNHTIQLYLDGALALSYPYTPRDGSDPTFDAPVGAGQIRWGILQNGATTDVYFGTTGYSVYGQIVETIDLARKPTTVKVEGGLLPDNVLVVPTWTKLGGVSPVITRSLIDIIDTSSIDGVSYGLSGVTTGLDIEGRRKSVVFEANIQVVSRTAGQGALNEIAFLRVSDGARDIILALTHNGTLQGVALATDMTFATAVTGVTPITGLDFTGRPHSLRIEKTADSLVVIRIDRDIKFIVNWDSLPVTSNTGISFGTGVAGGFGSQCRLFAGGIYFSKPGEDSVIETPIIDFLATLNTNDTAPIFWVSSDNGITWCDGKNGVAAGLDYTHGAQPGTQIIARIGFAKTGSYLYDYSVMYNQSLFERDGIFKYYEYTAVGGETLITLPFSYTQGNYELEVIENGVELYVGATRDFVETSPTSITLTAPAVLGDRYKLRVNRRIVTDTSTAQADVIQLAADLYTTPSLDHDGFANLDNPIQTMLKGYSKIDRIRIDGVSNPSTVVRIVAPAMIEINGSLRRSTADFTIDLALAGDREGSLTTLTWYYIYATADTVATTFGAKYSATAPTLSTAKSGYYHPVNASWRCIGSCYYVGGTVDDGEGFPGTIGIRPFNKLGNKVSYYYYSHVVRATGLYTLSLVNLLPVFVATCSLAIRMSPDGLGRLQCLIGSHTEWGFGMGNNHHWIVQDTVAAPWTHTWQGGLMLEQVLDGVRSIELLNNFGITTIGVSSYTEPF